MLVTILMTTDIQRTEEVYSTETCILQQYRQSSFSDIIVKVYLVLNPIFF